MPKDYVAVAALAAALFAVCAFLNCTEDDGCRPDSTGQTCYRLRNNFGD